MLIAFYIFLGLWTIAGTFIGYCMADDGDFKKLNTKATLLLGFILGPIAFPVSILGVIIESVSEWSKTRAFQKMFYKPKYIEPEERNVDRAIVVVHDD